MVFKKKEDKTLEWQWNRCKGHVKKVYETERSIFMKCQVGHKTSKEASETYPVFMIRKDEAKTHGV